MNLQAQSTSSEDGDVPVTGAKHLRVPKRATAASDAAVAFWIAFGFEAVQPSGGQQSVSATLPSGVIALIAPTAELSDRLWQELPRFAAPPLSVAGENGAETILYRIGDASIVPALRAALPEGIRMEQGEGVISLPFTPGTYPVASVAELGAISDVQPPQADVAVEADTATPLTRYSTRGRVDQLEADAEAVMPLLGNAIMSGQSTIVYAPPGTGKTLLIIFLLLEAIHLNRVNGDRVYLINADDNGAGAASKARILDDVNAHCLVPGFAGFSITNFIPILQAMIDTDTCKGVVLICDTVKKFVDTMDKRASSAFGQLVRLFVAKGGTFVGLAHTRKNPSADGRLVHGGTNDLLEDADAACILTPVSSAGGQQVVQFRFLKRRGNNVDEAYRYAIKAAAYDELIASVQQVDPDTLDQLAAEAVERSDETVIAAIEACIRQDVAQKMLVVAAASAASGVSRRRVVAVLDRYVGDDPSTFRWSYTVQARGAKVYSLHAG